MVDDLRNALAAARDPSAYVAADDKPEIRVCAGTACHASGRLALREADLLQEFPDEKELAQFPDEVRRLEQGYDQWWDSVQPQLVNETAVGPQHNPFKARYWKQFGGGPKK